MRGGLDDALDKLARRDELRRRAAGEITTPPAVTELVEAIAAVVGRHPKVGVTVGVEGAGDPVLLHFYYADGVVQVNADRPPVNQAGDPAAAGPRHADIDIDLDDPLEEPYSAPPAEPAGDNLWSGRDDQDRFGPAHYGYAETYGSRPATAPWHHGGDPGESLHDLGERMPDPGVATSRLAAPAAYPGAFGGPPPPASADNQHGQATMRIRTGQYPAPAEPDRIPRQAPPGQRGGMPAPLAKPVPIKVERPEETEMAARRIAALLRDDPSLLHRPE